jgi:hypothetical protein
MRLKIAVLPPMPMPSESTATALKTGSSGECRA